MADKENISRIIEESKQYLDSQIKLAKLNATEQGSLLFATVLSAIIIGIVFLLFVIFGSILLAFYLAELLNSNIYGFGIVTGIYFLKFLVLLVFRKHFLHKPFQNQFIKYVFSDDK